MQEENTPGVAVARDRGRREEPTGAELLQAKSKGLGRVAVFRLWGGPGHVPTLPGITSGNDSLREGGFR